MKQHAARFVETLRRADEIFLTSSTPSAGVWSVPSRSAKTL